MSFTKFPLDISAIVIDLDGTLLHTAPELSDAANRMLRDMDYPPAPQELLSSYIGNGISWLVKRALTGEMHATPDAALYNHALPIFEKHYTELLLQSEVFDGVIAQSKSPQNNPSEPRCPNSILSSVISPAPPPVPSWEWVTMPPCCVLTQVWNSPFRLTCWSEAHTFSRMPILIFSATRHWR